MPLKTGRQVDYSEFHDNPVFAGSLDKAIQVALEKTRPAVILCSSPRQNTVRPWRR